MSSQHDGRMLTSLAMLSTQWNDSHHSYLDNFVLFAVNAVVEKCDGSATYQKAAEALKEEFGFDLPQTVIRDILKRAVKQNFGKYTGDLFIANKRNAENRVAQMKQQRVTSIREQEELVRKLVTFTKNNFDIIWTNEVAENVLQNYVEANGIALMRTIFEGEEFTNSAINQSEEYIFFEFVEYLLQNDHISFQWLEAMVKGSMLASAIYLPTNLEYDRKFRNTTLWLDTSLVLQILGLHGFEMFEYMNQILSLAITQGANIGVFSHVLKECKGIIRGAANDVYNMEVHARPGTVLAWFRAQQYSQSQILAIVQGIEEKLLQLQITFYDSPERDERFEVDETSLEAIMQSKIHYARPNALRNDLDSLTAIFRLRRNFRSDTIENCRHLLLTDNDKLVRVAIEFFRQERDTWPIAALDHEVGSLLWLKTPLNSSELPRKKIIADALSGIIPSPRLWQNFLREIEKLESAGSISDSDLLLMRHGPDAEKFLMQVTVGDDTNFSSEMIDGIITKMRLEVSAPVRERLESVDNDLKKMQLENIQLAANLEAAELRIENAKAKTILYINRFVAFIRKLLKFLFSLVVLMAFLPSLVGYKGHGLFLTIIIYFSQISGIVTAIAGGVFQLHGNFFQLADKTADNIRNYFLKKFLAKYTT